MAVTLVVIGFTAVAAVTDAWRRKIYNATTYPGILAGFLANAWDGGWPAVEDAGVGFFVCGGMMIVCMLFFPVGGGDVKLLAMLGACLGLHKGLEALLWTFVIGSVFGIAYIITQVGIARLLQRIGRQLFWLLRIGRPVPLPEDERQLLKSRLFLAPAAFLAVLIVRLQLMETLQLL